MKKVVVVGGGAAGLMAAVSAARSGAQVYIVEKMPALGRKILITGKGRCNLTNACDIKTLVQNMPGNGPFLFSAFHAFSNNDLIEFMAEIGVQTKVERGGRVFPASDKAADVVAAFERILKKLGVAVYLNQKVMEVLVKDRHVSGVKTCPSGIIDADRVILTTGGASYPGTGSSGDGYVMAKQLGHSIVPLKPSLVPLEVAEEWISDLQGLALRNVKATVINGGRKIGEEFGEMLFTHYGLSGPIILSLSNIVAKCLDAARNNEVLIEINLKPALSAETLDKRIQRDFEKYNRKQFKNALNDLLPSRLIETVIDLAHIDPDKPVNQITKAERLRLAEVIQHFSLTVTKTRPVSEAIVTAGGVSVKEINPSTMESKLVNGLYFAGEIIDIDGYTGGFNLQAAFSTGYVAGKSAATQ